MVRRGGRPVIEDDEMDDVEETSQPSTSHKNGSKSMTLEEELEK